MLSRRRIRVQGVVQGVGFRPFVHQLATAYELAGHVFNSAAGVVSEAEGTEPALDRMARALREELPPLARIDALEIVDLEPRGDASFTILPSVDDGGFALVPPDASSCDACLAEVRDPRNRRFGYPFTNCTHCGPRYTIIRDVPYDRPRTTMSAFVMCDACQAEYDDPRDRRFHAQPNACPVCGPRLSMGEAISDQRSAISGAQAAIAGGARDRRDPRPQRPGRLSARLRARRRGAAARAETAQRETVRDDDAGPCHRRTLPRLE